MNIKMITIAASLALTGCAHNGSWVGPAVAGAVVGAVIHDASQHRVPRHASPPPVYHRVPPPRQRQCYSIPLYDYHGRYLGARVECH